MEKCHDTEVLFRQYFSLELRREGKAVEGGTDTKHSEETCLPVPVCCVIQGQEELACVMHFSGIAGR